MSDHSLLLGRMAHDVYVESVNDELKVGGVLPSWDRLPPYLQHAWASIAEMTIRYHVGSTST